MAFLFSSGSLECERWPDSDNHEEVVL